VRSTNYEGLKGYIISLDVSVNKSNLKNKEMNLKEKQHKIHFSPGRTRKGKGYRIK
jgi:hypothetical protein